MASLPNRLTRLPRIGDAKIGLIPTQLGLLTSVLGIGLQNITKPPTVTTSTGPTGSTGSGAAHDNMPPFMAVNVFIFAGLPVT